jgi:hypothetical protein
MRYLFAGALLTVAIAINVSVAEDAPVSASAPPAELAASSVDPCVAPAPVETASVDAPLAEVAAIVPLGPPCPAAEQGFVEPVIVVAQPAAAAPGPILVGPPPRNLTSGRIYRR